MQPNLSEKEKMQSELYSKFFYIISLGRPFKLKLNYIDKQSETLKREMDIVRIVSWLLKVKIKETGVLSVPLFTNVDSFYGDDTEIYVKLPEPYIVPDLVSKNSELREIQPYDFKDLLEGVNEITISLIQ